MIKINIEEVKKCVIDDRIEYDGYEYNIWDAYIDDIYSEDTIMLCCYHPIGGDLYYEHFKTNIPLNDKCFYEDDPQKIKQEIRKKKLNTIDL